MVRWNVPMTRENYVLYRFEDGVPENDAEIEASIPGIFRVSPMS
jgi:hypothetical protein